MLQIYRVEHAGTGVGPYQTVDEFTQDLAQKAGTNRHLKYPGDDGLPLGHLPYCFVFGCLDLRSLKRWFFLGESWEENERIVETLKEKGFRLAEYLVEEGDYQVSVSGIQVAFHASGCKEDGLVQYHDLGSLFAESPRVFDIY